MKTNDEIEIDKALDWTFSLTFKEAVLQNVSESKKIKITERMMATAKAEARQKILDLKDKWEREAQLELALKIGVQEDDEQFIPIYWDEDEPINLNEYIDRLKSELTKENKQSFNNPSDIYDGHRFKENK